MNGDGRVGVDDVLSGRVLRACVEVHRALGPGLLESAYEDCLCYELTQQNVRFQRQVAAPIKYKAVSIDAGYRIDLLIEGSLIVEIKAIQAVLPIHVAQVLTYLKLSNCDVGLLINFNVTSLRQGIRRITKPKNSPPSP